MMGIVTTCDFSQGLNSGCTNGQQFDDSKLGQAALICSQHEIKSNFVTEPPSYPQWPDAWKACEKVWANWLRSETVRQQHEYEAQVERDRETVNEFAKGLK